MRIQYCSDLHIDRFPEGTPFDTFVKPVAQTLVIAGDVCPVTNPLYSQFLQWCRQRWQTIILITGNHEYFCYEHEVRTFDQTDAIIRKLCTKLRIYFLQAGQSVWFPGTNIRFVGATLWSAVDPAIWDEVENNKGDYLQTYQNAQYFVRRSKPSDICALHALHKAHLESTLVSRPNEILIVVTHHMPTYHLLEKKHTSNRLRTCYVSADDELFQPNIAAWICGHGHRAKHWKKKQNRPNFFMNARGYPSEINRSHDIYNPEASFSLGDL